MKKELLKKFEELKEKGLVDNFIDTKLKEVFLNSILNGGFSGWTHHVLLSMEGLSVTGALSQGSMTMEEYNDEAIRLATIDANREIDYAIVNIDDLEDEERKDLINKIMLEENLESEQEVIENLHRINVDNYFYEINYSRYKEFVEEYAESEWGYNYRENLLERINEIIALES